MPLQVITFFDTPKSLNSIFSKTFALRELTSTYWSNAFSDLIGADRGRWGLLEAEIYQRFAKKGYTGELLEHKSELLPSWYREAVEAKISSF